MYSSEFSQNGGIVTRISLVGEFDLSRREELRKTLSEACTPEGTVMVDLSEVTFMDLESVRELAFRCRMSPGNICLVNSSWEASASIAASGLGEWIRFDETQPSTLSRVS